MNCDLAPSGWRVVKKCADGGVVFRPEDASPRGRRGSTKNPATLCRQYRRALTDELASELADQLGVPVTLLAELEVGWRKTPRSCGWCFPERNGQRRIIGGSIRSRDGKKTTPRGWKRGLTIPANLDALPNPVLIVEGPTDVLACLALGLAAVGRPSCGAGAAYIAELFKGGGR